jgi:hypothetical protein
MASIATMARVSFTILTTHTFNHMTYSTTDTGITILLNEPVTLQVLANDINSITGIPVKIDSQVDSEKLRKTVDVAYTGKLSGLLSQLKLPTHGVSR